MTTIRRINVSQINGDSANANNADEIRPFGEVAFYQDESGPTEKLTLMIFDGQRTHLKSKILAPGRFYGSDADAGDGSGSDTIKLIPDATLHYNGSDQYIVVDPTGGEPGHIHLRAGGTQDASSADLYLGGELTFVRVSDTSDTVTIRTTQAGDPAIAKQWQFTPNGDLYFPSTTADLIIGEDEPGLTLKSSLGIAFVTNLDANSQSWIFDTDGNLTVPGTIIFSGSPAVLTLDTLTTIDVDASGNVSANYFIGNGSQLTGLPASYTDSNVTTLLANLGANVISGTANITTTANISGDYILGNAAFMTGIPAGYSNTDVADFLANYGSNSVSTTGNITGGNVTATGNITAGNLTGTSANVTLIAGSYAWAFTNTGNLVLPGNIFAVNYANGAAVSLGAGGAGNYTDSNVTTLLANLGSNLISSTANITTTGNIFGARANITGNVITGVNSVLAGVTNTILNNTVAAFSGNVNNYTQITFQNKNTGADATADYILTADNGSDTVNYGDFGIINSGYDNATPTNSLGNIVYAADTYIYSQGNVANTSQSGGNLVIGTSTPTKSVKVFAGGVTSNSIVATFSNTGVVVNGNLSATNLSGNISITGNVTGTSPNVSLVAGSYTATFDNTGKLNLPSMGGDEGGEINFGIPTANTSLSTRVVLDVYQDRVRFFDGNTKGAYIDLAQASTGVATLLNNRVSAYVNAGSFVTMDNLKATVTTSGNRSLALEAVSGSFTVFVSGVYTLFGGGTAGTGATYTVTTSTGNTPAIAWNFNAQGDTIIYLVNDTTNSRSYRITLMIGGSYNNNLISIERLV